MPYVSQKEYEEVLESMSGRRLRRYAAAADDLRDQAVYRADARVKAFIKAEKFDPSAKVNPDPRMIQYRNARYTLELMTYLKSCESALYNLQGPTGLRMIAKGLNHHQRAELLVRKMGQFSRPVVLSIDASRWDKHISAEVLRIEHSVYLRMHGGDPNLRRLLEMQVHNKCYTSHGLTYATLGKRCSGDANTALGNCLLMCIMVRAAMRSLGIRKYDLLDDGDDCLLVLDQADEPLLEGLPREFLQYGQELKLENRATTPEEVVFCQHQPVEVAGEWRMVQNWRKVLSSRAAGCRHWTDPNLVPGMLGAVGLCELALSNGVPILQEYALALIRNAAGAAIPKAFADDEEIWWRAVKMGFAQARPIHPATRQSFADAFGVEPAEQVEIERQLARWKIDVGRCVENPHVELSGHKWVQELDPQVINET